MNPFRLWRMLRHVPPRQVVRRAFLSARRLGEERVPRRRRPGRELPLAGHLPQPLFPSRSGKASVTQGGFILKALGREEERGRPVDWHSGREQPGTQLLLMNLHYMEYLEEVGDAEFRGLIDEWIRGNPPYQGGWWRDSWNSFSLSIRVVVWMQQLAARGLAEGEGVVNRSLVEQLLFLEKHLETDIGGNHLLKNIKALLWAGRYFDGADAARWRREGERLLREEIVRQVLPDGVHFELAPAYHLQSFVDLLEIRALLARAPLRQRVETALHRMADALARFTHPDGGLAQFGDSALECDYAARDVLRRWAELSGWREPAAGGWDLPASGFAGYRDGDHCLVLRAGRIAADELPAHAHGDVGSFEWSVKGRRVVVDTGVYEYYEGRRRSWSRATEAHNTVTVDGADQAEFWGSFRVGRRPRVTRSVQVSRGRLDATCSHDGYAWMDGGPVHERRLGFEDGVLEVDDRVTGRGQDVVAHLLLHPDVEVEQAGDGWRLRSGDTTLLLETSADVALREAEWYPAFGRAVTCRQLRLRYGRAPVSGAFRISVRA